MRSLVKRRIRATSDSIRRAERDLAVLDAQLGALTFDVDAARVESLVSDAPLARIEHDEMARQRDAMTAERERLKRRLDRLRDKCDNLLERLI